MEIKNGEIIEGKITGITKYGAFVKISDGENGEINGMIHISEISDGFIKDINELLKINQTVKAFVIGSNDNGKLALSLKKLSKPKEETPREKNRFASPEKSNIKFDSPEEYAKPIKNQETSRSFEDMMNKFKRESDEKMSDLKQIEQRKGGSPRRRKEKD